MTTASRPWRRRPAVVAVTGALLLAAAGWLFGLFVFVDAIPTTVKDGQTRTDAIVVLTGGRERLETGLQLLVEGKGERVLISGVAPNLGSSQLLKLAGWPAIIPADRIDVGHWARDTAGNASETAAWMRQNGYHSIRLVTGNYHMPRSLMEFGHALPEATVIPHPVFSPNVSAEGWWSRPQTARLMVTEYSKFLLRWSVHRLQRLLPAGSR